MDTGRERGTPRTGTDEQLPEFRGPWTKLIVVHNHSVRSEPTGSARLDAKMIQAEGAACHFLP